MSLQNDIRQKVFRVPTSIVISVGLSWGFIGTRPVDLDLSAVCFTPDGQFLDVVFFNHLFPKGTDEQALRAQYLVDPSALPYMFLSGDSMIGGEEENQMSGMQLAARRKRHHKPRRGRESAAAAAARLFNRLYEEEEVQRVQAALDGCEAQGGLIVDDGEGALVRTLAPRELSDEVLTFVMDKIPPETGVIFLSVSSYTGQSFAIVPDVRLVIYNETTGERVGSLDLKGPTGNGTASLAAMMLRVPRTVSSDAEDYWDLRELNVKTYGYSFVDVLPVMLDVLAVPRHSRLDALQNLPDYSLLKSPRVREARQKPLSDVRFAAGWSGEHDVDVFLVMLDEQNRYVDHIYPKNGKLSSAISHVARHSGDALCGGAAAGGDDEFIDLLTYRIPANVRSVLVGATYMESFGSSRKGQPQSLYDIPNLYLRLQNRTVDDPYSTELDRWVVAQRPSPPQPHAPKDGDGAKKKDKPLPTHYKANDGSTQPVRAVLLGVMTKTGMMPAEELFPDGRRLDQHYGRDDREPSVAASEWGLAGDVPRFEFVPIHQHLPVDPRYGFSPVIPFLQCVGAYLWGAGAPITTAGASSQRRPPSAPLEGNDPMVILNTDHASAGWEHANRATIPRAPGGDEVLYKDLWRVMERDKAMSKQYGIEVQFLEVVQCEPQLPDKFRLHCEAWLYGCPHVLPRRTPATVQHGRAFKTPFLLNRERLQWEEGPRSAAVFVVNKYDRVRVMLYEYATCGFATLELLDMAHLWAEQDGSGSKARYNSGTHEITMEGGGELADCRIRLRVSRVPLSAAKSKLAREVRHTNNRRERHEEAEKQRADERGNQSYSPCSVI